LGTKKGLLVLRNDSIVSYTTRDGLGGNYIANMLRDKNKVWLATSHGLRYYADGKIHLPEHPLPAGDVDCRGLAGGDKFPLYVNSKGVIYSYQNSHWDSIVGVDYATISLALDHNGKLWSANWSRDFLSNVSKEGVTSFDEIVKGSATHVYVDSKNRIWVSTWENGVYVFDHKAFKHYSTSNGLLNNSFWGVIEDDEGNIWLAGFGGGLYKFTEDPFCHYTIKDGLPSIIINTVHKSSTNELLVGSDNGMVNGQLQENDSIYWIKEDWHNLLHNKKVVSFRELSDGNLAIGTYNNDPKMLLVNNGQTKSFKNRSRAPVFCIQENSQGIMYTGTDFEGVYIPGKTIVQDKYIKTTTGSNRIVNISIDQRENIWFATLGGGVNILIEDSLYTFNEGALNGTNITKCLIGPEGYMWLSTEKKGIYITELSRDNKLVIKDSLNITTGFISNKVSGLEYDTLGRIWAGTNQGIVRISFDDKKRTFEHLNKSNGFVNEECIFDGMVQISDRMIIGTGEGITSYKLSQPLKKGRLRSIILDDLELEYQSMSDTLMGTTDEQGFPNKLRLEYHQNHLTFLVSTIQLTYPSKVRFRFMMDGLEDVWSPWSSNRKITYSSLPHGKFALRIQMKIDGENDLIEKVLTLKIDPPFWKEIWFQLMVVLTLIILLIGIYNWRVRKIKKDKLKLEKKVKERTFELKQQKDIIEEKNNEIMDSLAYAKRIQSAILPPKKVVKEYLEESFILYKPKDIVAGDFYWLEHKDGKVFFAAADCTGHGVPGAMVSVICNNGLNRAVREHGLTDPGKILDKTREIVIQEFEKSEDEVKDGMDIALCAIEKNKLYYAGAHNPLWIIRDEEIIEIKANKQPIGKFDRIEPYTTHTIDLKKGDTIYIFSDGYVDQFGGEKGKKFKARAFRQILLSIQKETMETQRKILDENFESWKGSLEQIDDVCVIGVRV
jgi:serine phosphatase RsbU (regulator of sigma subunit)/ligand-binding sensor domain-containing protein